MGLGELTIYAYLTMNTILPTRLDPMVPTDKQHSAAHLEYEVLHPKFNHPFDLVVVPTIFFSDFVLLRSHFWAI